MICGSKNKSYLKSQNLKIFGQGKLNGIVEISGAKNSALVLLAASLLTNERIVLQNVPRLTDIEKMANILRNLGVKIVEKNNRLELDSQNISIKELPYELVNGLRASFFCIGPLLSKFGEAKVPLPGGCNIGSRPIDEHINGLKALGAEILIEEEIVKANIKGDKSRLIGTHIKLKCPSVGATETLIMAASLAEGRTTIENAAREPEIQDLCQMLNKMGAKIYDSGKEKIIIDGVNELCGCSHKVIPDRIEAGTFLIAAAATSSSITISPVIPNHLEAVTNKLQESGSKITIKGNSITINCNKIKGVDIETAPFPGFPTDLQAPFTTLMAIANGESKITETIFENRMNHVHLLNKMGANIKLNKNIAHIKGVKKFKGMDLVGSDLRTSAALIIAGIIAEGTSTISGLEHLDRGYENFESKLKILGIKITREFNKKTLKNKEFKTSSDPADIPRYKAA
ncbi:UDP-N-acetylglucosamine 1-carboxyvinyltransferase [Prochlorococcus marinus]|jgi:UDP-N-acetylglucosamine 1-carboxyvinyltransferase|uniref:UDP-N-acetylglucosamine 1-carboxyvinyltransferase n=1 Tax=Prochlorococcus marinus (strain MIT 9301) TaxID=167546 RepID=MURA_PROM0|nr:UDP-N-acetylglucosamine 1-carboxyvinyltransferase [Prochlorococcus marinus]A3PED3.1 RecName: Full=UDP-N-acetylglucosamine 1-carboxyvinyltransferase; AltName: Full=Enoylpyruvate transferase; AltName: Full=UDP-N-acetylglucosamine enolpyruvyl transferase; Short=EPT [Prochlorococcus marinus str. MIT 9301]ABO18108.1 UDP-N-glucosamine 1-carboxyvinyltransferase [Prochlorococcus marinus str. MIT 9301]